MPARKSNHHEPSAHDATSRPSSLARVCLLVVLVQTILASSAFAQAVSIALRATSRIEPGAPVRVGDIAAVTGRDAQRVREVVVLPAPELPDGQWQALTLAELRAALQRAGIDAQSFTMKGGPCHVRRRPVAIPAGASDSNAIAPSDDAPSTDEPRVRDLASARVAQFLGVDEADLRVTLSEGDLLRTVAENALGRPPARASRGNSGDQGLLDLPTTGRTVVIAPMGSADRMPLKVDVYDASPAAARALIRTGTVYADVLVRRQVAMPIAALSRGHVVQPGDVLADEQWLPPSTRALTYERVVGSVTRTRLTPGRAVSQGEVELPLAIRRGQLVSVRCVTPTAVISREARAMDDGKVGEVIRFQPKDAIGKRRGVSFQARVEAPGLAVMNLVTPSARDEQPPRQADARATPGPDVSGPDFSGPDISGPDSGHDHANTRPGHADTAPLHDIDESSSAMSPARAAELLSRIGAKP
ncbi:MAG: flagella basal body P-ring formation protein FlgA [Planctomycetota bacterium]|nr:flagella basal body P-ring formation protein FlgA [Planctomycetota bacterium]